MCRFLMGVGLLLATLAGLALWRWPYRAARVSSAAFFSRRLSRPYGMAPAAFEGLVRACNNAHIDPNRITQTIGDYPLSVGYHHRDGIVKFHGQKLDYTAAIDLAALDLTPRQRAGFLESLAKQGFAAWYRAGGRWRGGEHIHAIYAPLRMKWQLQSQMRLWESQRRRAGKPRYRWQKRWRRNWN